MLHICCKMFDLLAGQSYAPEAGRIVVAVRDSLMEVGEFHHGFCCRLPQSRQRYKAIWVIVDRLTKSAYFLPMNMTNSHDCLTRLYIHEAVRLHGVFL